MEVFFKLTALAVKAIDTRKAILGLGLFLFLQVGAVTANLPEGFESYLDRPDILALEPRTLPSDPGWERIKAAQFSFIAFLLEAYSSDTKLYFLARDSEHLYDTAKLVTRGTPDAERIHLINISRVNMRDPLLLPYLAQNGITADGLRRGQKVLFIDTGYAGTISRVVNETLPIDVRGKIKTHLLMSSGKEHPSSRSFLVHLNPMVNEQNPHKVSNTIVNYEHMARYTERSTQYQFIDGVYHPLSSKDGFGQDGAPVDKAKSLGYMQDLVATWNQPQSKSLFRYYRKQAQWLHRVLKSGNSGALEAIKTRLVNPSGDQLTRVMEAQIRDLLESSKNRASDGYQISLDDIGLKISLENAHTDVSIENLIKMYPEWKAILESPQVKIWELFAKGDFQTIGNLIDANINSDINELIQKELFRQPAQGVVKQFQISYIKNASSISLYNLTGNAFTQPHAQEMTDLIKLTLEKAHPYMMYAFASEVFSQDFTKNMADLMRISLERAQPEALPVFRDEVFSKPHTQGPEYEVLRKAAEIVDPVQRKNYLDANYQNRDVLKSEKPVSAKAGMCGGVFIR